MGVLTTIQTSNISSDELPMLVQDTESKVIILANKMNGAHPSGIVLDSGQYIPGHEWYGVGKSVQISDYRAVRFDGILNLTNHQGE